MENKSYNIYDAGINNHKSDLIKKINSWNTDQGCIIEYIFQIPEEDYSEYKDDYSKIRYTVEFPMERESILFLNHELPTKNTELKVDYSRVKEKTDVYVIPVTGSAAVESDTFNDDGIQNYRHTGWVTPKAGYIVAWWDLNNKVN